MKDVDTMDFLKIDFLGLKTISVMRHACELIKKNHGVDYDMSNIPYEAHHVGPDPSKKATALFELLQSGDVAGVFQVEGAGMENLMIEMQPYDFQHIVAAVALFRPGPMENIPMYVARLHGEKFEYVHPDLEDILGDTYGVMVFQEQIIEVAVKIAGYLPGEADKIRKAVGKKIKADLDMHKNKFISGCVENGYSIDVGKSIWADIEFFARYGFNRAHAASYAMITCMTAFLKAHYRDEYLTALLTNEAKDTEKISEYASRMQLNIVQPNVQLGNLDFKIHGSDIVFGLGSIKGTQLNILREIADSAPFDSLDDMVRRVDLSKGKKTLEALIYSGAMDHFGSRTGMIRIVPSMTSDSKEMKHGQMSLFGHGGVRSIVPPNTADDKMHVALMQRQVTGIFFDHPAKEFYTGINIGDLFAFGEKDDTYFVSCMIDECNIRMSKAGNKYTIGTISDNTGAITFMAFSEYGSLISAMYEDDPDAIYKLGVRVSAWNGQKKVILNSISKIDATN
jgi:DNA polymerase-3 subunit alpha